MSRSNIININGQKTLEVVRSIEDLFEDKHQSVVLRFKNKQKAFEFSEIPLDDGYTYRPLIFGYFCSASLSELKSVKDTLLICYKRIVSGDYESGRDIRLCLMDLKD